MAKRFMRLWRNEQGIGTLEIIIIIAVLVLVAFAFRQWILGWVTGLFDDTDATINNIRSSTPPPGFLP